MLRSGIEHLRKVLFRNDRARVIDANDHRIGGQGSHIRARAGIGSGKGEIDIAVGTFDDAFYLPALIGQPLFHRSAFGIDDNDAVSASRINLTP